MRPKKKIGYHHGDLRRTLIDVSVDVIARQGIDALNLRKLATRAGVSSGAPYHHFADRETLLATIAREGFQQLEEAMVGDRDAASGASERLEVLGRAYVVFATTHPGYFRVMFRGDTHAVNVPGLNDATQKTFQLLCDAIEDCQRSAVAPAGDPRPLVLTAWALVHGLATLCVDGALPKMNLDPVVMAPLVANLATRMFAAMARDA